MVNNQRKYDITDRQEMFGIKKAVQDVAENMSCPPEWCIVEKVVNIDALQDEVFSHYAISATTVDSLTGKDMQTELAHLTINGRILKDYGDLHPEIYEHIEEITAPDVNLDLIDENTVMEDYKYDIDDIEESFEEL